MRNIILLLPIFALFSAPSSLNAENPVGRIEVCIENIRSSDGIVGVALFSTKKGFPDKNTMATVGRSVPAGKRCEVVFEDVPFGTYAVSVLHDENGNGKMDKGFLGIPKEGFGTSNNPEIKMGPPTFSDSSFNLESKGLTLNISMKYLRRPENHEKQ
jgi:uncharacterized protein (DUF2141 family)